MPAHKALHDMKNAVMALDMRVELLKRDIEPTKLEKLRAAILRVKEALTALTESIDGKGGET